MSYYSIDIFIIRYTFSFNIYIGGVLVGVLSSRSAYFGGWGVDTIKLLFTASLNTQQNVVRKHWFAKNRGNSINGVMASILASGVVNR